jgi:hypothetical protein
MGKIMLRNWVCNWQRWRNNLSVVLMKKIKIKNPLFLMF